MPAGRKQKPIALKRRDGDTKKLGIHKFEQRMGSAFEAQRGEPDMPRQLEARPGDDEAVLQLLETAREYWVYLIPQMKIDGLLAAVDLGVLTAAVLAYAGMVEAGRAGRVSEQVRLAAEYRMLSDRMGLNESARAGMSKHVDAKSDPVESSMAAFLKQRSA